MKEYKREYPLFSLCGLNCCLCPRYQTEGASRCPGCGGPEFHLKHPACAVITCNQKHDNVEFCYQCSAYPCKKYSSPSDEDSFITYRNVMNDFDKCNLEGIDSYQKELEEKRQILEHLLHHFNDGRRKNYYCVAVNLLPLTSLHNIMNEINSCIDIGKDNSKDNSKDSSKDNSIDHSIDNEKSVLKLKIDNIVLLFENEANSLNVDFKLRK